MTTVEPDSPSVNRRGLFLGAGVVALAATTLTAAQSASAKPPGGGRDGAIAKDGSPITTTIASTPVSGFIYRSVCMYDFEPFNPAAQKTWGGSGIYSAGTLSTMRATLEIPAGALVRDVEFYVYNNSGSSKAAEAWLYVPGQGLITSVVGATIPSDNSQISATRGVLASTNWGPYPSGSRLLVGLTTPTDGSVQINGARVGYCQGSGEVGLLAAPVRVYDSRNTTKLAADVTRTISLNSPLLENGFSPVAPGTTGVLINIAAIQSAGKGFLKVWSASEPEPSASALNFNAAGDTIANAIAVGVSGSGQIKVKSSQAVHITVDLSRNDQLTLIPVPDDLLSRSARARPRATPER